MGKKVWIINHYANSTFFEKGGRHFWIAKYLKKYGFEPIIICCNAKHNSDNELCFDMDELYCFQVEETIGVPYVFIKSNPYKGNGKNRIKNIVNFYINLNKSRKAIEEEYGKPDVVYGSSVHPLALVSAIKFAKKYRVKSICEIRDLWPESLVVYGIAGEKSPIVKMLRKLEKWIYVKCDALIFLSEGGYEYIREQGWESVVPKNKSIVVTNGIDLKLFDYNKENYVVADEQLDDSESIKVIYTGSIRSVNNLGLLLDVAKDIDEQRIRFLIWGDGDQRSELEERVKRENIDNVFFKGKVEKKYIPSIVSRADLNIAHNSPAPLFRFGISFNKIFEYMASGKPIFCDFPSKFNPVIMAECGTDVSDATKENIKNGILEYVEMSEGKYEKLCLNARIGAKQYSFDNQVDKIVKLIESLTVD